MNFGFKNSELLGRWQQERAAMALLGIDSTGKCTKKEYCTHVCVQCGWLQPIYLPGASLVEIIKAVVACDGVHDTICILSNLNKVVEMNWDRYMQTTRLEVWSAVMDLAEHIKNKAVSKHLILVGADVDLFDGAAFPNDYRRIQADTLNMLSAVGLNIGTGMERSYGDYGRFRGKLDKNWHIKGAYREEAIEFLATVLAATSKSFSVMAHEPGDGVPGKEETEEDDMEWSNDSMHVAEALAAEEAADDSREAAESARVALIAAARRRLRSGVPRTLPK